MNSTNGYSLVAWWIRIGKFRPEHFNAVSTVWRFAMGIRHNGFEIHGGSNW